MSQRTHNIYFHLHTVSGIVISVGLYIIFLAGAFTIFVGSVMRWEETKTYNSVATEKTKAVDYNRMMDSLSSKNYALYGRNMYITEEEGTNLLTLYLSGSEDSLASKAAKEDMQLKMNTDTYEFKKAGESGGFTMGDLLYDLHFYYQLGDFGYYLSGLVAFFFLFAIVTGTIVHWKKIRMNFFVFRPRQKLKTVWTDAHTVLAVIGLPFQFMYALTGAMFGLGVVVALAGSLMNGGSVDKYYETLYPEEGGKLGKPAAINNFDYNQYREKTAHYWSGFEGKYFAVLKMGSTNQQFRAYGYTSLKDQFLNDGEIVLEMATGKVMHEHNPSKKHLEEYVWQPVYRLHFANFNGLGTFSDYALKTAYFIMALLTCFVIITGVLIWLEARNKKNIPEKQRKFNEGVGHIYLSLCLSMLPVIALSLIVSKLLPEQVSEDRKLILNSVFFGGWLLVSIFFWLKKNNQFTNRYTLLATGVLGLCIPVVNGLASGNWIWLTAKNHLYEIFLVDALWILIAAGALFTVSKLKRQTVA